MVNKCPYCDSTFIHKKDVFRHIKLKHPDNAMRCAVCNAQFRYASYLQRHMLSHIATPRRASKRPMPMSEVPSPKRPKPATTTLGNIACMNANRFIPALYRYNANGPDGDTSSSQGTHSALEATESTTKDDTTHQEDESPASPINIHDLLQYLGPLDPNTREIQPPQPAANTTDTNDFSDPFWMEFDAMSNHASTNTPVATVETVTPAELPVPDRGGEAASVSASYTAPYTTFPAPTPEAAAEYLPADISFARWSTPNLEPLERWNEYASACDMPVSMESLETKEMSQKLQAVADKVDILIEQFNNITHWITQQSNKNMQSGAGNYMCDICGRTYKAKNNLTRHMNSHSDKKYGCVCGRHFHRKDTLSTHEKSCSVKKDGMLLFPNETIDIEPTPTVSTSKPIPLPPVQFPTTAHQSAINDNLRHYEIDGEKYVDPLSFLNNIKPRIVNILRDQVTNRRGIKWNIVLNTKFVKYDADPNQEPNTPHFRSFAIPSVNVEQLDSSYDDAVNTIMTSISNYTRDGSGLIFDEISSLHLDIAQYSPIRPTSYIPLPSELKNKKCIVNIINNDVECFKWSVLAKLHPVKSHRGRVSNYVNYSNELNFNGIPFPVTIHSIPKFEKLNNVSVNVYGYEKVPFPVYVTPQKSDKHVDLLLITNGSKNHYCLITNFSRFLASLTKNSNKRYFCTYCMHGFIREDLLEVHEPLCKVHGGQRVKMPRENESLLSYRDYHKQLAVPFVIYADMESITEKIHTAEPNPNQSHTTKYQQHTACGFSYVVVSTNEDNFKPPVVYRGNDAVDTFIARLLSEEEWIKQKLQHIEPMIFTDIDQINYDNSVNCHICDEELGNDRVRDHDHISGKFRGAAHNSCNLNHTYSRKIPVIMHNLRGYDSHLILQGLSKIKNKEITCIPNNTEKYVSFAIGDLQFIDSFQFMNSSLEKLVSNLSTQGSDKFTLLNKFFDKDKLPLLLRKGVYPYDEMSSFAKFEEEALPPKEFFYNILRDENVSDADYEHAQNVWESFNMRTMGDYHNLYLLTDTLLLADVFQNYRQLCMSYYKLDPCHFYTAPGLAWQACLKMTGVELELLTDVTMYNFVEAGLRGGISVISKRYCKANNPYMENYDSSKENSYIMYLDANNLYGYSMAQPLPTGGFRWLNDKEIDEFDITNVDEDANVGYILEVDLKYPPEQHSSHSDYPLAAEKLRVTPDMLSTYSKQLLNTLNIKHSSSEKLIPNLNDKCNYVIHHSNLKQCVDLGLQITKIHRVLTFQQSKWLKKYIDFNTEKRTMARNEFEKDFFKLMNNSVFGKTMENLRKRVNIKLVTDEKKLLKLVAMPSYTSFHIFDDNFVAVKMKQTNLFLNRPTYVGFCVLDISKTLMYSFHYGYMKKKYGARAQLAFTDTDSLLYYVTTDDIYKDMNESIDHFDTSDYPPNHFMYSNTNKKKLGKFKDETASVPIVEFVGLRSKMYSFKFLNAEGGITEKKTAKGITKSVTKKDIRHQDYIDCLQLGKIKMARMKQIRSIKHKLFSVSLNKIGLSPYDDKRHILEDGINTLAHGHKDIKL